MIRYETELIKGLTYSVVRECVGVIVSMVYSVTLSARRTKSNDRTISANVLALGILNAFSIGVNYAN